MGMMDDEKQYMQGHQAAVRSMLLKCLKDLNEDPLNQLTERLAQLASERSMAISMLRCYCERYGDNDWEDNLHLSDIIEKHLGRHLDDDEVD